MGDTLAELRNNINFASVAQFFHTFQTAFHPWLNKEEDYVFETEDLEKMILDLSERGALEDLIVRMLRLLTRNRFINLSTWQSYFSKEFDRRELNSENPFHLSGSEEIGNFFTFSTEKQIELLFLLCEWQLDDPERLRENLYSEEGSTQWRVDPVGYDKNGAVFWLFDDNRLYLQAPKVAKKPLKKKKRMPFTGGRKSTRRANKEEEVAEEDVVPWRLICCSIQDWQQIPLKYADSNHSDERKFHDLLVHDLLPKIIPILEDREKQLKKQEAMSNRKRSSRIMIRELEALEFNLYESRTRSSNRIEQKNTNREQEEKENLAKAREERVLERERRLLEREHRNIAEENKTEIKKPKHEIQVPKNKDKVKSDDMKEVPTKKKRGRKPKNRSAEEESWFFRCVCGISGKNLDDGKPMIACEKCNTWQHISCLQHSSQIDKNACDLDNLSFTCQTCLREPENIHPNKKTKLDFSLHNSIPHINGSFQSCPNGSTEKLPTHLYLSINQQDVSTAKLPIAEKGDSENHYLKGDILKERQQNTYIDASTNYTNQGKKYISTHESSSNVDKPKMDTPLDFAKLDQQKSSENLASSFVEHDKQGISQDLFPSTDEKKQPENSIKVPMNMVEKSVSIPSPKSDDKVTQSISTESEAKADLLEKESQANTVALPKIPFNGIDIEQSLNEKYTGQNDIQTLQK
ncbi:hypothetical protein BY458DRAFT_552621 [Sporodiniella umbellata]|nr:hypothetical protein BY458DRAFT_552621 [Sporodiniella umbellata]